MCIVKKEMFGMINIIIDFFKIPETAIKILNGGENTIAGMLVDE